MTWVTGVMVYIILWWLAWFAVLPLKVRVPENVPLGHEVGAPENPRLVWKAGLALLIAAVLWLLTWWLVTYDPLGLAITDSV
jgi:predicted secreted protein